RGHSREILVRGVWRQRGTIGRTTRSRLDAAIAASGEWPVARAMGWLLCRLCGAVRRRGRACAWAAVTPTQPSLDQWIRLCTLGVGPVLRRARRDQRAHDAFGRCLAGRADAYPCEHRRTHALQRRESERPRRPAPRTRRHAPARHAA